MEFIFEKGGGAGARLRKRARSTDHERPSGPATDAFDARHDAFEKHRDGSIGRTALAKRLVRKFCRNS